jgi:hypothetical protein
MLLNHFLPRLIAAVTSLTLASATANADCIADWSIAAPIVRKEGLATVEVLSQLAHDKIAGSIVRTTLCEESGGFVYRLIVRDHKGHLTNHTVDARAPFGR